MIIYKYILEVGVNDLWLPVGAKILSTKMQRDQVCVWFLIEDNGMKTGRKFLVAVTGNPIKEKVKSFIGTCMSSDHAFVCHVFEVE